ncbi:hypothetical protein PVAP13_1KG334205 [Panicum virgatum]|uniref:Uncharacterized protein n=1 Tax=Panicum virgatum TaxID=38727 RepID=A0A8T0XCB0_PANVG|nr:hypothetical protein PVAP13_1KG334205 [Panicum virgatum]
MSGEAREAGELAVHHQVAGRRRARHPSSSSPSIIRLFAGGIFHGGKSRQDGVDGSAAGQGAAGQRKIDLEAEPTTVSTSCRYRVIRQGSKKAAMAASLLSEHVDGGDAKLVMKASAGDNTPLLHRAWLPADDDGAAKTLR